MIVNFSCLKLGIGEKLFMLDLCRNDFIICKKNNIGKKGLYNEILQDLDVGWKLPLDYPRFPFVFSFSKERMKWNCRMLTHIKIKCTQIL